MADWKQITARIRRARTGKDPVGQLSALYEKTSDAMVAFELARVFETSGQNSDAAKWYTAAAERFRRSDWKTKAQEAAVRLGAELSQQAANPSPDAELITRPPSPAESTADQLDVTSDTESTPSEIVAESSSAESAAAVAAGAGPKPRRRRGRRGGRNRRRGAAESSAPGAAGQSGPATPETPQAFEEPQPPRITHARSIPTLPVEAPSAAAAPGVRGRSGDPGLSSRLSALEMQLRRLLTCPPTKLNDADHAPAGPGVFVLTDSDLTSYYYVEACKTLRIAIGGLLRGGASRRDADSIKPRLAEHLGIPESRVSKYLADHCVVRWLQLDEGASYFAHFVIAVIRPVLNE